jgi:multiple sugar transport system ATP-binding protein
VYVTHDQVEAMTLGDRIAVMKDGVVLQFGTPADIYTRPATLFVAEFIGSPAMNLFAASHDGSAVQAHGVALPLTDAQRTALQAHAAANAWALTVGLRPEDLALAATGLPGTLSMIEPTGPETYLTASTALGRLTARVPGNVSLRVGDAVHLQWAPAQLHLFDAGTGQRLA